ncbi:MAG: PfkB family carbohydrate kinase [Dehalococcoidia bacterium]
MVAPSVLIAGAVTWDVFGGERRAGGAVSYAARAAAALGVRARILTIAGGDASIDAFDGHEVHVIASEATLTFEHQVYGEHRRLRVLARPERALAATDLPRGWLGASMGVAILGPLLADDLDVRSLTGVGFERVGLLGQGLQRTVGDDGVVEEAVAPSSTLFNVLSDRCSLFLSEDECLSWPTGELARVVEASERVVVTRGSAGAEVLRPGQAAERIEPTPAEAVDTTGAGDVFSTAFFLGVTVLGLEVAAAGALASRLAAAKVGVVGAAALPRMQG